MKKVLVSDSLSAEGIEILKREKDLEIDVKTGLKPDELKAIIGQYHGLVIRSATKVTADLLAAADNLEVIGRAGIGVDNVDVPAATKKGVVVMNTPGGNTTTTAEHAIALMMSLARFIPQATASMKRGEWEKKKFEGREMTGKTLGVVGLGAIGSIVADRAVGLKMKVIAYDPFITPDRARKMGVEQVDLEELYRRSDLITIHVPKLPETTNLINKDTIGKMKKGVYIICAARGGIVNEDDLLAALEAGQVAGAALDVFAKEPPGELPLIQHPNLICTPHLGASTEEAQAAVALQVADQISDYLVRGIIVNSVNVPSVPADQLERMRPYLELAESLGKLQGQRGFEGIRGVEVEVSGHAAEGRPAMITSAALAGLMSGVVGDWVNVVNATVTARERGISVKETICGESEDYAALIRLRVEAEKGGGTVAGAIFGKKEPRLVEIDSIYVEAIPKGNLLILTNNDKPGLVGSIGVTLGKNDINIGQLQFGRDVPGGKSVTVVNVDSSPDESILKQLRDLPNVLSVTKVCL